MVQTLDTTVATGLLPLLKENAAYNQWANNRMINWLKEQAVEAVEKTVASSFKGLRETLLHIWDVERGWLATLKKEQAPTSYRFTGFEGSLGDIYTGMAESSKALYDFVQSLSEEELQETCHFKVPVRWPEWDDFYEPRFQIIQHCVNHAAYHRGQMVTIGHQLGITNAPMTDYMAYLLTGK